MLNRSRKPAYAGPMPAGGTLPFLSVLPFAVLLLGIAVCPLWVPRWWEPNGNKALLAVVVAAPVVILYLLHRPAALVETAAEYVSFLLLLPGRWLRRGATRRPGAWGPPPAVNTAFLGGGAVLASVLGTTGASMLLIRPLLQTNRQRTSARHTVIFFIFLVSNAGGLLTPLGDPPLFLGYLEGVPLTWTLRLWPIWLATVGPLLSVYFVWDSILHAREPAAARPLDP